MSSLYMWDKFSIGGNQSSILPRSLGGGGGQTPQNEIENGSFATDVTGWTSARSGIVTHVATDGGRMRVTTTGAQTYGGAVTALDTVEGHVYEITGTLKALIGGGFGFMTLSTGATSFDTIEIARPIGDNVPITGTHYHLGTGDTVYIHCFADSVNGEWAEFDDISVTDMGVNLVTAGNNGLFTTDVIGWVPTLATTSLSSGALAVTKSGAAGQGRAYAAFPTVIGNTYFVQARATAFNTVFSMLVGTSPSAITPEYLRIANGAGVVADYKGTFVATETTAYFYMLTGSTNGNILIVDNVVAADLGVL